MYIAFLCHFPAYKSPSTDPKIAETAFNLETRVLLQCGLLLFVYFRGLGTKVLPENSRICSLKMVILQASHPRFSELSNKCLHYVLITPELLAFFKKENKNKEKANVKISCKSKNR